MASSQEGHDSLSGRRQLLINSNSPLMAIGSYAWSMVTSHSNAPTGYSEKMCASTITEPGETAVVGLGGFVSVTNSRAFPYDLEFKSSKYAVPVNRIGRRVHLEPLNRKK